MNALPRNFLDWGERGPLGQPTKSGRRPTSQKTIGSLLGAIMICDSGAAYSVMDPDIFDRLGYDELRLKGLRVIAKCHQSVKTMSIAALKEACKGKSLFTPKQCQKIMLRQLQTLKARFLRTTDETSGSAAFRDDISILLLNLHDLLAAGIGHAHEVVFQKWQPKKFNVYTLVEKVVDSQNELAGC